MRGQYKHDQLFLWYLPGVASALAYRKRTYVNDTIYSMAKLHYRESPTPKQKSAFAPYLSDDEELILVTGLGSTYLRSKFIIYLLFPGMVFGGIFLGIGLWLGVDSIVCFLIGVVVMVLVAVLKTLHTNHANRYLLTTSRVIIKKGLFSVKLTSALFDKITNIEVDQSFFDRIFLHHGTIVVNTSGLNKNEMVLRYVDYPIEFKNLLERLISRERDQSGQSSSFSTVEGEILE